jgi:peptidoglycan hydrolase CwlO-like protein
MKSKTYMIALVAAMTMVLAVGGIAFAMGPGGGSMGGGGFGMMGGGGMMGGYGSMGQTPFYSSPPGQYPQRSQPYYRENLQETQRLRQEIQEKRQELSNLYRSDKSDKAQIDQKIKELGRLEAELDQKLSGNY